MVLPYDDFVWAVVWTFDGFVVVATIGVFVVVSGDVVAVFVVVSGDVVAVFVVVNDVVVVFFEHEAAASFVGRPER